MPDPTTHITTSGGLLTAAFIEAIRELGARQRGVTPETFATHTSPAPKRPADLEADIAAAWELLLERWDSVRAELPMMDISQVRSRWLLPLFRLLDFEPVYLRADTVVDGNDALRFPLTHRGWNRDQKTAPSTGTSNGPGTGNGPVLHLTLPTQDLDARAAAENAPSKSTHRRYKAKSPHDMVQAFLNVSRDDTWAVLTNGVLLRLLRTYHHTFTKGYVQFDLEAIFETRNYGDFRALYRLCHASRFPLSIPPVGGEDKGGDCPLEWFYQDALATGVKVGEDLRGQVRQAIETLGNGFLDGDLIQLLTGQDAQSRDPASRLTQDYYAEILHIIYRILFLLFAEQRGLLPHAGAPLENLYRDQYSITALRGRAEGDIPQADTFTDLWEGLKVTFAMVSRGAPELGVFGYDGMLFADGQTPLLGNRPIANSNLLRAIRALTLIERAGVLQRISYADLGVEELGSIYESLLDYTPRVTTAPEIIEDQNIPAHTFILDARGMARKTSGSYYTHPSLVNELIKSALLPVMRDRLADVIPVRATRESPLHIDYATLTPDQRAVGEEALLAIKICDPAVGSGHFLVKANNVLGAELARVRTGDDYPTEAAVQAAKRDVLAHCIYAVDLNPMAVELCKVSLWINASVRDAPLNFLDHHIRWGNSLVGATPALLEDGIPADAFALGRAGDDRAFAKKIRAQHRDERRTFEKAGATQPGLFQVTAILETPTDLLRWVELETLAEVNPQAARERFVAYQIDAGAARAKLQADTWTAAFFWPLTKDAPPPPTFNTFRDVQARGKAALTAPQQRMVATLAEKHCFFHWHLAFPDVFGSRQPSAVSDQPSAGFDVILGNPPWERIKLQEKEFFGGRAEPAARPIADARTAAVRHKLIKALPQRDSALYAAYIDALHGSEALSGFLRDSGRYPLSARGDVNTYQVFAGLVRQVVGTRGRVGVILPTGIATDFYNKDFFAALVANRELVSLYDFENRQGLFPGVHRNFKFSLLTLTEAGTGPKEAEFAFFSYQTADLDNPERHFSLSATDLARINPNTQTCPIFRTRRDAELTRRLYRTALVLVNKVAGSNPWGVHFATLFHMANDSGLFYTREQLIVEGYELVDNCFTREGDVYLPLYEAKMMHQFEHRHGTYEGQSEDEIRKGYCRNVSLTEYTDPRFLSSPRYWVVKSEVEKRVNIYFEDCRWFMGFRDVTRAVDRRTAQFALLPFVGIGHKIPLIFLDGANSSRRCAFLGNINAFVLDYIVRQKIGGISLSYFILEQLPVLPPDRYTDDLLTYIVPRVLELTYTAWDLRAFADDVWAETLGNKPLMRVLLDQWEANRETTRAYPQEAPFIEPGWPRPPFTWHEERRAQLRADLDALYAHLYDLTREELDYILETFPIVKRKDEEKYGEYRTKRMVLEAFDALASENVGNR